MSGGMILKDATIFGQSGGTLLGGGEAGDEAVVGVSSLRSMIQDAVSSATLSVSGDQPLINIEEMNVRSDDDIRKISQQLNTLLTADAGRKDWCNMGFSFNGTTSKSMGLATRITNEYRMPDLRNNTITMPGRHGVFDFGETVSERKILISCFIPPGKTDEQFLSKKDDIIEWLNPDNGLCQLILDKEPGRVYEARLTSGFSFDRAVRNSCTFDLEFFCPDPYGYAISDETFDFAETGTFTASRALGNIESYPVYSLTGVIPSGTDSYISITTNGSELQIIGRLAAGETLIIDSDLMTAKVVDSNGETLRNGLPLLSELNFPVLNTGDNTIVIAAVGTITTFTELNIQARSRWR